MKKLKTLPIFDLIDFAFTFYLSAVSELRNLN